MIASNYLKRLITISFAVLVAASSWAQQKSEAKEKDFKPQESKRASKLDMYRSSRSAASASEQLDKTEKLIEKDPEGALDIVQEALATSIAQGDALNEARSYELLGRINSRINEWKLAAQNYEHAYTIYSSYRTSPGFLTTLKGLAASNMEVGNYDASVNNYNELLALKLPPEDRLTAELDLSEVYYRMGDYDRALKIAESIETGGGKKATLNKSADVRKQNQLAKIYAKKNDLGKTKAYLDNSLNSANAAPPSSEADRSTQNTKEEVANVLRSQQLYDEEIELRNKAIDYNLETKNLPAVAKDKVEISKSLEAKGESNAALRELLEATTIADTLNDPRDRANAYLSLANMYERRRQNENALNAYKKYSEAVTQTQKEQSMESEQRSRILKKQNDIEQLSSDLYLGREEDTVQKIVIQRQQGVIIGLVVVMMILFITAFIINKSAQSSKRANRLLALKSLRSQMNPHFIFNALNSVNHFIAQQDERTANKFLSEFSQLMRLVLEYSQEDFITLQKEQEILALYMKLEHYRFRDKFDYEIDIDPTINAETVLVPPMLIQPYIENAVWHGLRYRESKGFLKLTMTQIRQALHVTIEDNGIGRKKSAELKTENQRKHKSTGLQNIRERLSILNRVYKTDYEVNVTDGENNVGTRVVISLPIQNRVIA